jgi:hypothetical protein
MAKDQDIRCVLSTVFESAGTAFSKSYTLRYEIERDVRRATGSRKGG